MGKTTLQRHGNTMIFPPNERAALLSFITQLMADSRQFSCAPEDGGRYSLTYSRCCEPPPAAKAHDLTKIPPIPPKGAA